MKLTLATLAIAAQLTGAVALAQTTESTTGTGTMTTPTGSFGSDWSSSLGSALFGEDGSTVRSTNEIETQWQTVSEEDRAMVRRDCIMFMQEAGGSTDTGTTGSGTTDGTATTGTTGTTGATADSATSGAAGGTSATGTAGTSGVTGGSSDTVTSGTAGSGSATGTSATGAAGMMEVSDENMQAICAATADL